MCGKLFKLIPKLKMHRVYSCIHTVYKRRTLVNWLHNKINILIYDVYA